MIRNGQRRRPGALTEVDVAIITKPLRRVTMGGIHVCKRDGEVNKVKIEVIKTPVFELFLRQCLGLHLRTPFSLRNLGSWESAHMIMGMERVPELKINRLRSEVWIKSIGV